MVKFAGLAPGVTVCGENVTLAPGGRPVALRTIGKLNAPSTGVNAKLNVTDFPGITVWLVEPDGLLGCGVSAMLKSSTTWDNAADVLLVKFESPE